MKYELVREVFTYCDNSRKRQVTFSDLETDDPDMVVRQLVDADGGEFTIFVSEDGTRTYDIVSSGFTQRVTLNPES